EAGGLVEAFNPNKLPQINPRIHNRNHRKIVVIDGQVGYIGGSNVGDEYLGRDPKMGAWRDTHLRIEGNAVKSLQLRFMLDWNSHDTRNNMKHEEHYFPEIDSVGDTTMQIASSGPDENYQQIKYGYLNMIYSAKKHSHSVTLLYSRPVNNGGHPYCYSFRSQSKNYDPEF